MFGKLSAAVRGDGVTARSAVSSLCSADVCIHTSVVSEDGSGL
jgi:hypothetical protein